MCYATWASGFFLSLAFCLALGIITGNVPSTWQWGGVVVTSIISVLLLLASRKQ